MQGNSRILVVDDEARYRTNLVKLLARQGFEVLAAGSGQEALDLLARESVDVVLLDLKMPDMSGVEVLTSLRARGDVTLVVILTGHASVEAAMDVMRYNPSDYLLKPCSTDEIVAKIESVLERARAMGGRQG